VTLRGVECVSYNVAGDVAVLLFSRQSLQHNDTVHIGIKITTDIFSNNKKTSTAPKSLDTKLKGELMQDKWINTPVSTDGLICQGVIVDR